MYLKSILFSTLFFFSITHDSYGQTDEKVSAIQIELDVLGFAQEGFGIVGGYVFGKNRVDFDLLSNTLFNSFTNTSQDFEDVMTERRSVMSINYYRYINEKALGFYYGAGLSYYEYIVEHDVLDEVVAQRAIKPGVYIGYDLMPFKNKGFYIDAWLGLRWHWEGEEEIPYSNGEYYLIPAFDAPLGMIKFGWRFNTN